MKNKTLYIHIGANKTGTTSIQSYLAKNKATLEGYDICYPNIGTIWNAHFPLAWELGFGTPPEGVEMPNGLWEELESEIINNSLNSYIISSENFILCKSKKSIEKIKKISEMVDVKIVVYLRKQDEWIESLYLQAIKMGVYTKSFSDYVVENKQELDFNLILQPWEETFGKENIIINIFDNNLKRKGIINSFISLINSNYPKCEEIRDNDSIDANIAFFIHKNAKIIENKEQRRAITGYYEDNYLGKPDFNNKMLFDDINRSAFANRYMASNLIFCDKYSINFEYFKKHTDKKGSEYEKNYYHVLKLLQGLKL